MSDGIFGPWPPVPAETVIDRIDDLAAQARAGNESAAKYLLSLSLYTTELIRDILEATETPGSEILRTNAKSEILWPCAVSRLPEFSRDPLAIAQYLAWIKLGAHLNIKTENFDQRTKEYFPTIFVVIEAIFKRGNVSLERNGLSRDKWLASETGRKVKAELREILGDSSLFSKRLQIQIKGIVNAAVQKAERVAEAKSAKPRGKEPAATRRAVETAIVKEIASLIYGVLSE